MHPISAGLAESAVKILRPSENPQFIALNLNIPTSLYCRVYILNPLGERLSFSMSFWKDLKVIMIISII